MLSVLVFFSSVILILAATSWAINLGKKSVAKLNDEDK